MVENSNLEERLEEAEGAQFRYRPISPKKDYNRMEFLAAQEQLNDLTEYNESLGKDPHDVGAREDLCGLLFEDENEHMRYSPEQIRKLANESLKDGTEKIGRYVEHNSERFMDMLGGEELKNMIRSLPLYKNGHKEHDKIIELINDINGMRKIMEENDLEKMTKIVMKKTKSKAVPDWAKKIIKYFAGDVNFVATVFQRDLIDKESILEESIRKEDGNYDVNKLRNVVKESLDVAYEKLEDKDNSEKEKRDIWEKCIRPYYLVMAGLVFEIEKKELEEEDENIVKKNKRKAERKKLGMAA